MEKMATLAEATSMTGRSALAARARDRRVALWLFACCAMIFAMVIIGGITRLTESGLSIVEWEPIGGAIPPLSDADWQQLFAEYKTSPQYHLVNAGMDLAAFKTIFWWEYLHRLWGRLIGFVFLVPFLGFLARGYIRPGLRLPIAGLFVLGALQGAIGWWMVASGLRDDPMVSPVRLTIHLAMALIIYLAALWLALSLWRGSERVVARPLERRIATGFLALAFMTVLAGGLVAGLRAGLIYNTFPLMGGDLVPADYVDPAYSWILNAVENPVAAQLHHRVLGITTVCAAWGLALWARRHARAVTRPLAMTLATIASLQVALGIATLVLIRPVPLAAAHQAGAVLLLTMALVVAHRARRTIR